MVIENGSLGDHLKWCPHVKSIWVFSQTKGEFHIMTYWFSLWSQISYTIMGLSKVLYNKGSSVSLEPTKIANLLGIKYKKDPSVSVHGKEGKSIRVKRMEIIFVRTTKCSSYARIKFVVIEIGINILVSNAALKICSFWTKISLALLGLQIQ